MLNEIKQDLINPRRLLNIVMIGLVLGAIDLPQIISFSALIYSGGLAKYAAVGIGMGLVGAIIMEVSISLLGSAGGVLNGPQDSPTAVLSLVAGSIGVGMVAASDDARFATVLMAVIISSVSIGVLFLIVGWFNLNRFIRFVPYPVVGGFIAGTGLLLAQGAFGIMTDVNVEVGNLSAVFQPALLPHWIPGIILGIGLLFASRRSGHFLVTPAILVFSVIAFYGCVLLTRYPMPAVRADDWLLGPFPDGALWKPLDVSLLSQVDWDALAAQSGNLVMAGVLSILACLLNMSALELILQLLYRT